MRSSAKPLACVAVNRYGLKFGKSRNSTTYASGRRINGYYSLVCLRCGWAFRPPAHLGHRLVSCDAVRAQRKDPLMVDLLRLNLIGPIE